MAIDNTILRVVTGSELYGTKVGDGLSDRDEIGICIEDKEYVYGLQKFDQYVYRDAAVRAGETGQPKYTAKSQPGDLDLTIYSLKRFLGLVVNGNPTLALIMYTPVSAQLLRSRYGDELLSLAPKLACVSTGKRFLHYMYDQKERLLGRRGQKDINRPELVALHGYDTKYAGHVVRLGFQGREYLKTGHITLPMPETERQFVLDVRNGKFTLKDLEYVISDLDGQLEKLLTTSLLRKRPDVQAIDRFLVDVYQRYWDEHRYADAC